MLSVEVNVSVDILRAALTITADNKQRAYGRTNPPLTASYTGFVNGDTLASLDAPAALTTSANRSSLVGTYPIVASGASDANYAITFVNGTLTVTKQLIYLPVMRGT